MPMLISSPLIPNVIPMWKCMRNNSTSVPRPPHFIQATFIRPAENAIKIAALVNSSHTVNTAIRQRLECHIACAHYCLTDIVQAVIAVEDEVVGGHCFDAARIVGKSKKVLEIISKLCSWRCS